MIMQPVHHPSGDLIAGYASGALDDAIALVVATHCAQCKTCARALARYESIGGVLLERTAPVALSEGALEAMMRKLDAAEAPPSPVPDEEIRVGDPDLIRLSAPVREIALSAAKKRGWQAVLPGIKSLDLAAEFPARAEKTEVQLLRIAPGQHIPRHTHGGLEYSLVLSGGFEDETGLYNAGDLSVATPELMHRPVAQPGEDCLALVVSTGPLRFTGVMGVVQRTMGG